MPYNKNRISELIKQAAPTDKKPLFDLNELPMEKLKTVSEVVLAVAVVAGAVALTAMAPNIFQALNKMKWVTKTFSNKGNKYKDQNRKINKSIYYLKRKGYIVLESKGKDFLVKISQKGRKKILSLQFENLKVARPEKWDGFWWLVIADIPNEYKRLADFFRKKVKEMGFYPLQRTVWIYPYDPRDEINFISAYYQVDKFMTIMRVDKLEPDDEANLKIHFQKNKGLI